MVGSLVLIVTRKKRAPQTKVGRRESNRDKIDLMVEPEAGDKADQLGAVHTTGAANVGGNS